ncbi:hypothetical protein C8Q78DRAFT_1040346 [Trametes maxima]|nr:hypothetical protein C8Q78DRAFT_1040346 [Trametes maxima]
MSDLGYNVWGAIAGVIGIVALVPVVIASLRTRLPSAKLPALLRIMKETQNLFVDGINQGLLTDENDIYHFHLNIWAAHILVDGLREEVNDDKSWRGDLRKWREGLSGRIVTLYDELDARRRGCFTRLVESVYAIATAFDVYPAERLMCYAQFSRPVSPPSSRPFPHCSIVSSPTNPSRVEAIVDGRASIDGSVAKLKELVSLALMPPRQRATEGKRQRLTRREVLLRFGRQLYGVDTPDSNDVAPPRRHARRTRLKTVRPRIIRSNYRGCPQDMSGYDARESGYLERTRLSDGVSADEWVDD